MPVLDGARKTAPALKFPATRKRIRRYLSKHFGEWGAITTGSRLSQRFGVSLGACDDPETRESFAGVRVWYDHRAPEARVAVLEKAATLPRAYWDIAPTDDDGAAVSSYARLVGFNDLESLTSWYTARIDELASAGILATLASLKAGPAPMDEEDDEDGEPEE